MDDIEKRFAEMAARISSLEVRLNDQAETMKKLSKEVIDVGEGLVRYIDTHGETHSKDWDFVAPIHSMAQAAFFKTHPEAADDLDNIHKITGEPDDSGYEPKR